ncbi:hypothetical protein GE09DRAFT_545531 [Coniochaeta sp. 2T2.1]|nr:hypothetical protein GE09DRAFT_545531 [Coniochaeta sp. 2T2.1]
MLRSVSLASVLFLIDFTWPFFLPSSPAASINHLITIVRLPILPNIYKKLPGASFQKKPTYPITMQARSAVLAVMAGLASLAAAIPLNVNLGAYSPALVVGDGAISFEK